MYDSLESWCIILPQLQENLFYSYESCSQGALKILPRIKIVIARVYDQRMYYKLCLFFIDDDDDYISFLIAKDNYAKIILKTILYRYINDLRYK